MPKPHSPTEQPLIQISPFGKDCRAVLVFPEPYHTASSNLGFHQVFRLIGQHRNWSCERAVVEPGRPIHTLEGNRNLSEFDLIAFSVPFELGYLNVLKALHKQPGFELLSRNRGEHDPIVAMGGIAVSTNPAVMAPFADLLILGEGEAVLPDILGTLADLLRESAPKTKILEACARIDAVYVPSVHGESPKLIAYGRKHDMDESPPHSAWLTEETEFGNTLLFEISRGCPCACRFCMIRRSQKPLRAVSVSRILELTDGVRETLSTFTTGETSLPKIGLVGAAVASHPDFEEVYRSLHERGWEITVAAIEIDKATEGLLDLLSRSQKTLTLAPERGLEAERFRLGKRISDEHLLHVAQSAGELGIPRLKLYFVVGIVAPEFYGANKDRPGVEIHPPEWMQCPPGEEGSTDEIFQHEAESVSDLVNRIAEVYRPRGKRGTIAVTCSPFIPKPHTPWEGWPMASEKQLKHLDKILRNHLGKTRAPSTSRSALRRHFSKGCSRRETSHWRLS